MSSTTEEKKEKKVVGHYELGAKLGKGSFSSVRVTRDVRNGKKYAMKILDKQQLADQNMGDQVNREIHILLQMTHENIAGMRECFQTSDSVYLILELVEGGELFDEIVKSKKFDEATARTYFQQLVRGLHYCHKHGIAHRDLKPENLLVTADRIVKITDFGLSNMQKTTDSGKVESDMMLKTVCGTPNYVAPEVLRQQGYNGFKADIWSCGVILYVMVTGKLPFADKHMPTLFKKIQKGMYTKPDGISGEALDLLSKLLCVKPEARISMEEVMEHEWFKTDLKLDVDGGSLRRTASQEKISRQIAELKEKRANEFKESAETPKSEKVRPATADMGKEATDESPEPQMKTRAKPKKGAPKKRTVIEPEAGAASPEPTA